MRIPTRRFARVGVVALLVLATMVSTALDAATLKVRGTGWWSDFELGRNLRLFFEERGEDTGFSSSELIDAHILLSSALMSQGFLNPDIVTEVTLESMDTKVYSSSEELWDALETLEESPISEAVFRVKRGLRTIFEKVDVEDADALPIPLREARGYFYPQNLLLPLERYRIYSDELRNRGLANLRRALVNDGYRGAHVDVVDEDFGGDGRRVSLLLGVDPGPLTVLASLELHIMGPDAADADWHRDLMAMRDHYRREIGAPWTPFLEREIRLAFQNVLYSHGFAEARVQLAVAEGSEDGTAPGTIRAQVTVEAAPGRPYRIREVSMEGLERTRVSTVEREIGNLEGNWYDPNRLDETRRQLYRLGIFQTVRVTAEDVSGENGADEGFKDIAYTFEESMRQDFILRGGIGSYEKIRAGAGWEYRNLWGRAHRLRTNVRGSLKSSSIGVDYMVPHFLNLPLNTTFSAEWLNREEVSFDREEWSIGTRLNGSNRRLGFRYFAGYSLRSLNSRNFSTEDQIGDTRFRSGGFDFGLFRDRRNNPVLPTRGYRWRANLDWVSPFFGAQSDYQRLRLNGSHHWSWAGWQWNAGLRHEVLFALGGDESDIPVNSRIFAGGESTIRGFREGRASPRGSDGTFIGAMQATIINLEVERAVTPQLNAVAFYDALLQGDRQSRYPGNEFLHSAGLGLRLLTPLGPVRFEYGRNITRRAGDGSGAWHFSLGFPF